MRTKLAMVAILLASSVVFAQDTAPAPPAGKRVRTSGQEAGFTAVAPGPGKQVMIYRHELGAWWKDSKIAEKLGLSDNQIRQLEDAFYQHRLKLVDFGAEMEKADMKLQQLLDADTVDESAVNSQVDQVLAARGKTEREFTMMHLEFRKILTNDQWKQLKSIRGDQMQDRIFMRHAAPPGGPQGDLDMPELVPQSGADCTTSEKNGMKVVQCTKKIEIINDTEHEL